MNDMTEQLELGTFILREKNGTIIQPWKEVKDIHGYEWLTDPESAVLGQTRIIESATYTDIEKDTPVRLPDKTVYVDFAIFYDDADAKKYKVAERLLPRSLKFRDAARLSILGCCNIMTIVKRG
jgi:hypothetical protein